VPCKFGCQECRSKNIEFKEKEPEKVEGKAANIVRGRNLGSVQKDDGFKDVLRKIKDKYPGSTIDV
jgi:hypothetical protein